MNTKREEAVNKMIAELSEELAVKTEKATKEQIAILILQIIECEDIVRETCDMPSEMKDYKLTFTIAQRIVYRPYTKWQEAQEEITRLKKNLKEALAQEFSIFINQ